MAEREVKITELAEEAGGHGRGGRVLHPLQAVGYALARYVLAAMAVAVVMILWLSFVYLPQPVMPVAPSTTSPETLAQYQSLVEAYSPLAAQGLERAEQLLQTIVVTIFLPSFTAILGYIFGTRQGEIPND